MITLVIVLLIGVSIQDPYFSSKFINSKGFSKDSKNKLIRYLAQQIDVQEMKQFRYIGFKQNYLEYQIDQDIYYRAFIQVYLKHSQNSEYICTYGIDFQKKIDQNNKEIVEPQGDSVELTRMQFPANEDSTLNYVSLDEAILKWENQLDLLDSYIEKYTKDQTRLWAGKFRKEAFRLDYITYTEYIIYYDSYSKNIEILYDHELEPIFIHEKVIEIRFSVTAGYIMYTDIVVNEGKDYGYGIIDGFRSQNSLVL